MNPSFVKPVFVAILFSTLLLFNCKSTVTPVTYQQNSFIPLEQSLKNLAFQLTRNLTGEKVNKVAIMEFSDFEGNTNNLSRLISEELISLFFELGHFEIVERSLLDAVIYEQSIGLSGFIDASSAAKIGKILGADAIVIGTLYAGGSDFRVNARLISTETASVFGTANLSIQKTLSLSSLFETSKSSTIDSFIPAYKLKSNEFTFEVINCIRSGSKLRLYIFVNPIANISGKFIFESFVVDNFGKQQNVSKFVLPNGKQFRAKPKYVKNDPYTLYWDFSTDCHIFFPNTNYLLIAEIKNFDRKASLLSSFDLFVFPYCNYSIERSIPGKSHISFKNIPVGGH